MAPTWACGLPLQPINEYTGKGFVKPLRIIFRAILRPEREVRTEYGANRFFHVSMHYHGSVPPIIEEKLYRPALRLLLVAAHRIRLIQNGSIQSYLAYIFAACFVLAA